MFVVESEPAETQHRFLEQKARVVVGNELRTSHRLHHSLWSDNPADAQSRKEPLGKGANVEHSVVLIESFQRGHALPSETELGVEIVLDDRKRRPLHSYRAAAGEPLRPW